MSRQFAGREWSANRSHVRRATSWLGYNIPIVRAIGLEDIVGSFACSWPAEHVVEEEQMLTSGISIELRTCRSGHLQTR